MATKNLTEMKDKLYQAFDAAMAAYDSMTYAPGETRDKVVSKSQALGAAAQVAQAVTSVEHEIAVLDAIKEARERGDNVVVEISGGTSKDMAPLSTIKFKPKES